MQGNGNRLQDCDTPARPPLTLCSAPRDDVADIVHAAPTFAASPAASWDEARNSANGVAAGVSAKAGEVFSRFGTKVYDATPEASPSQISLYGCRQSRNVR